MELVQTPPGFAAAPVNGLFWASAETPAEELTRIDETGWRAGALTGWRTFAPCGPIDTAKDEITQTLGGNPSGMPFLIEAFDRCTTMSVRTEHQVRAAAALDRVTSAALAREFWTGALRTAAGWTVGPRLAGSSPTVVTSGAVTPARAVSLLLEAAAPKLLTRLAFHISVGTLPAFAKDVALTAEGTTLTTIRRDLVIADPGYPGTNPTGAAPAAGQAWIYATARPVVHLGPKDTAEQDVDRASNNITARAERPALITCVPGVWAAQVTLT